MMQSGSNILKTSKYRLPDAHPEDPNVMLEKGYPNIIHPSYRDISHHRDYIPQGPTAGIMDTRNQNYYSQSYNNWENLNTVLNRSSTNLKPVGYGTANDEIKNKVKLSGYQKGDGDLHLPRRRKPKHNFNYEHNPISASRYGNIIPGNFLIILNL